MFLNNKSQIDKFNTHYLYHFILTIKLFLTLFNEFNMYLVNGWSKIFYFWCNNMKRYFQNMIPKLILFSKLTLLINIRWCNMRNLNQYMSHLKFDILLYTTGFQYSTNLEFEATNQLFCSTWIFDLLTIFC